jgi:hypothetical protein
MDVQQMYQSLQTTFGKRLPDGLSDEANSRLRRTLKHYVKEITESGGSERDILRETYESMAKWLKRNTSFISSRSSVVSNPTGPDRMSPLTMASFDAMTDYTLGIQMPSDDEENPIEKFERLKARRASPQASQEFEPIRLPPQVTSSQPKDFIIRQQDVVKYRETEFNLILNSKDRDWVTNSVENRYNFSVQLDSAVRPQGTGYQATITNRFRNITKIEFIKAILPVEGLDVVIQRDCASGGSNPELSFVSALSMPYVNVIMDEMTGNNFGTNDSVDKSLAVCQYDATWKSDSMTSSKSVNRGYTLFIPKFMKAQRIYAPTPLASLQKMSFCIQNPENQILTKIPDAVRVSEIVLGSSPDIVSCYSDISAEYLFVRLMQWVPMWSFSTMDRTQFAGLTSTNGNEDIIAWLQQESGNVVVGCCQETADLSVIDGPNDCGYVNYLVIRNRFKSPTSGDCERQQFNAERVSVPLPIIITGGSVINLSRQVQLTLRITVRELDATTNLRPDNV